jgi:hypothetical protein
VGPQCRVTLTTPIETLAGVVGERLQHAESRLTAGVVGNDERLVDQSVEQVLDVRGRDVAICADAARRANGRSVGEDGQPLEHDSLVFVEQLIAPIGDCSKIAMMRLHRSRPFAQELESVRQAIANLVQPQVPGAGSCQLECERQSVELLADLHDRVEPAVPLVDEPGAARFEQFDGRRWPQRVQGEEPLRRDVQPLAAGRHDSKLATAAQQLLDDRHHRLEDVFTVVESENRRSIR